MIKNNSLVIVIVSLSLAFGYAGTLQAAPIKITLNYELDLGFGATDPTDAIFAEAFLDTSSLGGTGTEDVVVDQLDLQFSVRAGAINSGGQDLTVQTATSDVFARYLDGVFAHFHHAFSTGAVIRPSSSFNKEIISLGLNGNGDHTLLAKIEFCGSCNTPYVSVGDVTTTSLAAVPLPPSMVLFASGLLLLTGRIRVLFPKVR